MASDIFSLGRTLGWFYLGLDIITRMQSREIKDRPSIEAVIDFLATKMSQLALDPKTDPKIKALACYEIFRIALRQPQNLVDPIVPL
ncbi:MAG TPA: hypothetical protein VJ205_00070 [Gammaproteobacteria bacterium]|nr:hypothetical protein [Gammaproteobacteria bacterium]